MNETGIHVYEGGSASGETLVFLHGGNVAGWMWGEQLPAFNDYRHIVPDFPGFGASNHLKWRSIGDTADHLAALIAELSPGGAHLVGLSLGSSVAIEIAGRYPELTRSLFLASAQLDPPSRRAIVLARVMLGMWNHRGFWTSTARSYGLHGADADLFVQTGLGIRRSTAVAILEEVSRGVTATSLARIAAPVIAVAGSRDSRAVSVASLDRLAAAVPHSHRALAEGMHHQWNIENVSLFNAALRFWLESGGVSPLLTDR